MMSVRRHPPSMESISDILERMRERAVLNLSSVVMLEARGDYLGLKLKRCLDDGDVKQSSAGRAYTLLLFASMGLGTLAALCFNLECLTYSRLLSIVEHQSLNLSFHHAIQNTVASATPVISTPE